MITAGWATALSGTARCIKVLAAHLLNAWHVTGLLPHIGQQLHPSTLVEWQQQQLPVSYHSMRIIHTRGGWGVGVGDSR